MSLFSQILQFLLTGITIGTIYGMVGLGFNIIYNATGIINFAQCEFVMLGGMVMVWLTTVFNLPLPVGFLLSVLIVTCIGAALLVTETLPLPVRGNQTKTFLLKKLMENNSSTLQNYNLTLEFTANPAWYAIQALPYMMEYPYECIEQIFNSF